MGGFPRVKGCPGFFFDSAARLAMLEPPQPLAQPRLNRNPMKHKVIIALSTCPNPALGRVMAEEMVESGLAACVNLVPGAFSVYRWDGRVQTDEECLMVIKTTAGAFAKLRDWLQHRHPYELPELVVVRVTDGLPAYLTWIATEVAPSSADT
jgi:periplasmic divalent cation tolerance protein